MTTPIDLGSFDTDVLIVGAGPIGLTTACALGHHGVDFLLLEKRKEHRPNSRANNVWARPQELLDSIGVRDVLAAKSYRIKQVNTLLNGQTIDPVRLDGVDSPYADVLYSGQDVIESVLSEQVEAKGGVVEWGREIVDFEQDADGVTVIVKTACDDEIEANASMQRIRCRYLVGADGGEGFVRRKLDLEFEPKKFAHRLNRQVDAKLSWRRSTDPDRLWFFYYENGFCGVMPVWGGYHRLFFLADDAGVPDRDPTLAEIQTIAREVTEDETLTLTDPIWLTHSRFQHGAASHYGKERVLLVGDSGHRTLPIGGQGMNAGFHDAVAVAWRLAMTLAGRGRPILLESYDTERGGEHRRLDKQQEQGFRNVVYRGPLKDAAFGMAAKLLPDIGSLIQGTDDLQQLSVGYDDSPLNEDHLGGLRDLIRRHIPRSGDRAPDAKVVRADGVSTTLFSQIYNPDGRSWGWSLLAFDGRRRDALPDLQAAVAVSEGRDWIRPRLVLGAASCESDVTMVLSDLDGEAHAAYGIEGEAALVLLRPDGHIAFRGAANRPDLLEAYCKKIFC